jgi:hypothetical protein
MKKLYIFIIGLFSLLNYSCIMEKGNELKPDLPVAAVTGYATTYAVYTHRDTLRINPVVENEGDYDFAWTMYSANFNVNAGTVPKPETLATSKNLNYEVLVNPGQYILVFNVTNKRTGVTKLITSNLSISTLTMNGWYLLKDDGVKTDFDFIHANGRIDNWIANFNNGKTLSGKSVKSVFAGNFKSGLKSTDLFSVLVVLSDQDAAIYRVDNGQQVMGFNDMFFTKPDVKKPQNVLQAQADNLHLINDGKLYSMSKGSLFALPAPTTNKLSAIAAVGALDIGFDENSKSVVILDGLNFITPGSGGAILKNMNASAVWMGVYPGARSAGLLLFRKDTGEGLLVKINATYGPMSNSSGLITDTKTIQQTHGLMNADIIAGNYDSDYIYYAKDNKIYETDFASLPENLQVTLPEGETVTCIQHIKYPHPTSGAIISTTDYLAIASYAAGKYKVWLHKISSTGTIQALANPNFEGQGKVTCVNYLEQGFGNKTF